MDLAREPVDAFGEFGWVGDQVAAAVALVERPAVVDVDVGVAEVFEAEVDEGLSRVEDYGGGGGVAAALVLGVCVSLRV